MQKKWKITIVAIIIILITSIGIFEWYLNDYYHANSDVSQYFNKSGNVTETKIDEGIYLDGPGDNKNAVIFYQGAKVEYTSYLPLMYKLSSSGVDSFLVESPRNLALFGENIADDIINNYNYTNWYLSGHSLGGYYAGDYASTHTDTVKGVIFLASYTDSNLSNSNLKVLSIYGTNDGALNQNHYAESKSNLPSTLKEIIIKGGNHGQFGNYPFQEKDYNATISREEQQNQTIDAIVSFISDNSYN